MLTALIQEVVEDVRAGGSFSTGPTAPAASPAEHTAASQQGPVFSPDVAAAPSPTSQLPEPRCGDGLWSDICAYDVEIPQQGIHAGQLALGTNCAQLDGAG